METTAPQDTLRLALRLSSAGTVLDYSALSYTASGRPLFTVPQAEIVGAAAGAVLAPAIAGTIARGAVAVLLQGAARTYRCRQRTGEPRRWYVTTISPTVGHELLVVVREVTDRRMRQLDVLTAAGRLPDTSPGPGAG